MLTSVRSKREEGLLTGKRVVITAGASGIGLAISQKFLAQGADVFVCDMAEQSLAKALATNPGLRGAVVDVGDPRQVEPAFEEAIAALGGVDVMVNNAGIGGPRAQVEDISYEDWDECIRINLSAMFYCVKQVVPAMKAQGGGSIINISTGSARTGLPHRLPYVASKVGVLGLSHNLARELGRFNIRCNAILPGLVDNARGRRLIADVASERGSDPAAVEQEFLKHISMRTWIQPEEIGEMAVFLSSDVATHVTGQEISVDGNVEWEE